MDKLTPLEKVKAALKTIDKQRQLSGRDDLVIVPEYKFYEGGLDDPADVETLLARFQREGIIEVVGYKELGIELLKTVTAGKDGFAPPVGFRQRAHYVAHHLRVIPEKFDKYFEEQISKPDEDKDKKEFPWNEGCRWINEKTFSCWCGKTLTFRRADSERIKCFRPLVDRRGGWAKVKDIATHADKLDNEIRIILNQINSRIKNSDLGDCFEITPQKSWKGGAYRINLLHLPED